MSQYIPFGDAPSALNNLGTLELKTFPLQAKILSRVFRL